MVTYRLDGYDGGLDQLPEPADEGLLRLSDSRWSLTFRDKEIGVDGGLLRSEFAVEAFGRRRSVLRLTAEGSGTCSMILLAPASKVERAVALRMAHLAWTCEETDGAASGEWWRDSRVFAEFGPLRATSIGGVRFDGGWWRSGRAGRARRRAVLDFAREGLVLRKWRRKLTVPWPLVDTLEIVDGPAGATTGDVGDGVSGPTSGSPGSRSGTGTTIVVRSPSGRTARFSTSTMSPEAVRGRLAPILERIEETGRGAHATEARGDHATEATRHDVPGPP